MFPQHKRNKIKTELRDYSLSAFGLSIYELVDPCSYQFQADCGRLHHQAPAPLYRLLVIGNLVGTTLWQVITNDLGFRREYYHLSPLSSLGYMPPAPAAWIAIEEPFQAANQALEVDQ